MSSQHEVELEDELEAAFENEDEGEQLFGQIASGIAGLLGEGELEFEDEDEAEEFFKGIGRFVRRAAPILKRVAKIAAPMVATAVGGPAAGLVARAVTSQLEGELEDEM